MPAGAIFISYSRHDLDAVKQLKSALDAAGVVTWFDLDQLDTGDEYRRKIQANIEACSYFMPVISASTSQRAEGFFHREWNWALERMEGMAEGAIFLLPVIVDDTVFERSNCPRRFLHADAAVLPGGRATPEFIARVTALAGKAAR
jgi:hypothetical protein